MSGEYGVGQVCLNGHAITGYADTLPQLRQDFCGECGSPTITTCPNCNADIRGRYRSSGVILAGTYTPSSFCHKCGRPYPWTEAKLHAAQELASEIDNLTIEEKNTLRQSLDELIRDTPQTQVAAMRFKRLIAKAGTATASAFRELLVDIASEAAKKALWP